jgi:hypothetical protein
MSIYNINLNIHLGIDTVNVPMKANNFAMKDWHLEHVEKVIIRYIKGISPTASSFEKRNFKKYSTTSSCAKQIEYDIKHGVTSQEVLGVMQKIRRDKSFSELRSNPETVQRLDELERQLSAPKKLAA